MGAILEPTTAMDPYSVEMRAESFYLNRRAEKGDRLDRHTLSVPAAEISAFLAALEQVRGHLDSKTHQAPADPDDTTWTLAPDGSGEPPSSSWTVSTQGNRVRINGPWIVMEESHAAYGDDPEMTLGSAEITYWKLDALAEALAAVTSSR